jgi:L-iditol 2-dehydrogenase
MADIRCGEMNRAFIPAPHKIFWQPDPSLDRRLLPEEVRLEPLAVGICGSDLHTFHGLHPFVQLPVQPGHEVAARVLECGSAVDSSWLGALVALEPSLTCGQCRNCQIGRYNICENLRVMGFQAPGAMAEQFICETRHLHRLPEGMSPEVGACLEPLAVAVHAVRLFDLFGREVTVLGAGTIGLLVAQVARALGASAVWVVDFLESRRQVAAGLGFQALDHTPKSDLIFECVGTEKALEAAIVSSKKGAEIGVVGVYGQPTKISAALIQDWELVLRGSLMYTAKDYQEAIGLLSSGAVAVSPLITHRFGLPDVAQAFQAALERDKALKVMLLR